MYSDPDKRQPFTWGPRFPINVEPAPPVHKTVRYWELACWENGVFCNHVAPEDPADVDMHSNITLACSPWEPIGGTQWRRHCTLTYLPGVTH